MYYKRIFGFLWLVVFSITSSHYIYSHHCNHKGIYHIILGFSQSDSGHQPCTHNSDKGCYDTDSHSCDDACCSLDNLSLETVIISSEKRLSKHDENFDKGFLSPLAITSKFSSYIYNNVKVLIQFTYIYNYAPPLEVISTVRLIC